MNKLVNSVRSFVYATLLVFLFVSYTGVSAKGNGDKDIPVGDKFEAVECTGGPCVIIPDERIVELNEKKDQGLRLTYGRYHFKTEMGFARADNPVEYTIGPRDLVPDEVHIPKNSFTSIPQMGLYWHKGQLLVSQPSVYYLGDFSLEVTSTLPLQTIPVADEIKAQDSEYMEDWSNFIVSYCWDGAKIMSWYFIPVWDGEDVVLHMKHLQVVFLTPIEKLVEPAEFITWNVLNVHWKVGELLTLVDVKYNSHKYEDKPDSQWKVSTEWADVFVFKRADGSLLKISYWDLIAEKACETNACVTRTFTPQVGQAFLVNPYSIGNKTLWVTLKKPQ